MENFFIRYPVEPGGATTYSLMDKHPQTRGQKASLSFHCVRSIAN
jgi:hypothetical protein